jgi:hypothetical protein
MIQPAIIDNVRVNETLITFVLIDGREVSLPLSRSHRLVNANQSQRDHFEIEPGGLIVEWPELDEHIGVWTLLGVSEEDVMAASQLRDFQIALR